MFFSKYVNAQFVNVHSYISNKKHDTRMIFFPLVIFFEMPQNNDAVTERLLLQSAKLRLIRIHLFLSHLQTKSDNKYFLVTPKSNKFSVVVFNRRLQARWRVCKSQVRSAL